MRSMATWSGAVLLALWLASAASAADTIAAGRVKGVDADKREFVLTDAASKDFTFKLSDRTMMNRGGAESQSGLTAGDSVFVCYEKGLLTWTARYILIREGDSKNWELAHGKMKSYEAAKQYFTYTDDDGRDMTFPASFARVWVNNHEVSLDDLKIGEPVLLIVAREGGKTNLLNVMCERAGN